MAVGIFKGIYVTAESATNYIDVAAITAACESLKEAGEMFLDVGSNLGEIALDLGQDTLSVQGATMQQPLEECGEGVVSIKEQLTSLADQIMEAMNAALDRKQILLNEEAAIRDAAEHERNAV